MGRYLSPEEEQEGLTYAERKKKLLEDADKPEEGLEEQGLEDYVMPVKNAVQGGLKAAVVNAVKQKAKVKLNPKAFADKITYDSKPNPKGYSAKAPKVEYKQDDKTPEWLKKLLEE